MIVRDLYAIPFVFCSIGFVECGYAVFPTKIIKKFPIQLEVLSQIKERDWGLSTLVCCYPWNEFPANSKPLEDFGACTTA